MNVIHVFYTRVPGSLAPDAMGRLAALLPADFSNRLSRITHVESRIHSLMGRLLLTKSLEYLGISNLTPAEIVYDQNRRPYFSHRDIDFNISHSGEYVVCAITHQASVGIDIEKIAPINYYDYQNTMNASQWADIYADKSGRAFFKLWTLKEAVLKACGTGLIDALKDISINGGTVDFMDKAWHFAAVDIDDTYICHVAFHFSEGGSATISKVELTIIPAPE